ncbi:MAG: DNRLRE domain-containing protein [Methanobacteriota archaeon]|nr:MAG: DNRLRE domain-containing protein [Euryarchaeota archaeon]
MNSAITTDNSSARFIFPSGNRRDKAPALAMSPKRSVTVLLFAVVTASFLSIGVSGRMVRGANGLQIVVFQPGANGTDSFIESGTPLWNYGDGATLWVGPNATSGYLARALLRFDLAGVPSNATIMNATLGLYQMGGAGGKVRVIPGLAPWAEGDGGHAWTVLPVTVRETAGVNRTLEPVDVVVPFSPNSIGDPARDLRVYDAGREVPSQVYRYAYSGGQISSAHVFFGATVGAYGSQTYDVVYSTNGTSLPAYRTGTWSTGPLWTYGPTGGGASGATIADLDNDGRLDTVFGGTDGYVYCLDDHGNLKWRTLVASGQSVPFTPQVADVDRSGKLSVVVSTNAPSVVRLNNTGSVIWTYNSASVLFTTPTLVDVNGDGVLDALVGSNAKNIVAIDGRTGAFLRSYSVPVAGYTATIADIDKSGAPEILVDGDDKNMHAFALNGTQLWAANVPGGSFLEGSIAFGDVNGDGFPEVVTGDVGNNGVEFALWASNGTTAWYHSLPSYRQGGQSMADVNGDGIPEILVGVVSGTVYNLRGTDGSIFWSYNAGTTQAGTPVVADFDRSGTREVAFIEGSAVDILTATGFLANGWTISPPNLNLRSAYQFPMTSPALADLTGNGTLEILVPTSGGMAAFGTGGLDRDWRTWGYNVNHTQRFLDGASGSGAPLLESTLGVAQVYPAAGVSWNYRDGTTPWATSGGDFGLTSTSAAAGPGWMSWNLTNLVQDWVAGLAPNDGVFLLEASEITGALHAFVSSDSSDAAHRPVLTVAYTFSSAGSGNQPPRIVGRIPNVVLPENAGPAMLDLSPYTSDADTPATQLRWNVTGFDPSVIAIGGTNVPGEQTVTITPQPERWGDARVTYWLTDPQGGFDAQTAWINVTRVDSPPTFTPPSPLYVHSNDTYTFDEGPYLSDPDTPRALLTLTSDDPAHASVSGMNVSFRYPGAYLGLWAFVNLTVSDGTFVVTRVVAVKVTTDNPPVLRKPLPNVTMLEGQLLRGVFNLSDYFADPNQDALFYSTGYTHLIIAIRANLSVDIQAPADWWGQEEVSFRATDPTGAIAEDTILVTVLRVDAPPVWSPVPDLRVRFDAPFSFNLDPYISDPDTPSADLVVGASDPTHAYVSGHLLTLTYPWVLNGTVQRLVLSLSDGLFTVNRTVFVAIGGDWPPIVLTKMPDVSFHEGTRDRGAYRLSDYFADPDGSLLFWTVGNSRIGITIQANGSVDLTSAVGWWGTEAVTFRATDPQGALQEDSVRITVIHVDRPPAFGAVPEVFLNVTTSYLPLAPFLTDPDDQVSALFLVSTNSSHAVIVGQGLLLRYAGDADEYINVVVSDGNLTDAATIHVRVALPAGIVQEVIPAWLYWVPFPLAVGTFGGFLVYRRRQLEWAFLVTNTGLLVSSVSRRGEGSLDTDLLTGMLTTIMDFARQSFSDETERHLEGLELGEKRVTIVRGGRVYLAVVYRGRTPGSLISRMRALLEKLEARYPEAFGDVLDTSKLGAIPMELQRLVSRGNLPFVRFGSGAREA